MLSLLLSPSVTEPLSVVAPAFVILPKEPLPVNIAVVPLKIVPSILPVIAAPPDTDKLPDVREPVAITLPILILPEPP